VVRAASVVLDLALLAGGFPLAMLLARMTAGSAWPWATALLWLSGAGLYWSGLRLSPLKATLGQDLLGLQNRARSASRARPEVSPPPHRKTAPVPTIASPGNQGLAPPRLSPRPTPLAAASPPRPPSPVPPTNASPSPPTPQHQSPSPAGLSCPRCGLANRRDCRFCKACGTPLAMRLCPACSKTAAADARFCKSCGRPLS